MVRVRNAIRVHPKTEPEAEARFSTGGSGQLAEIAKQVMSPRCTNSIDRLVVRRIGMMFTSGIVCEAAGARANRA